MADTSLLSPFVVRLGGGLVLDKDTFSIPPGAALQLQNFEPDINGGYRRINGFEKYDTAQIGGSTGTVLGVHIYKDQVIAAKDTSVFKTTGSGYTSIDTGRTSAGRYTFANFNFDNTEKVVFCDGANTPSVYNNTAVTDLSNAPSDPRFVAVFKNHVFFAGMSTNPQEVVFSSPFDETDYSTANGAGTLKVDSAVKALKVFRDRLFRTGVGFAIRCHTLFGHTRTRLSRAVVCTLARSSLFYWCFFFTRHDLCYPLHTCSYILQVV
jgi:hypothetical protein